MTIPQQQVAPIYHRRIGDIMVTALSDGATTRTHEMMNGVPKALGDDYLRAAFRQEFVLSINAFLIYSANRIALVDTGSGSYLGPGCGMLLNNINAAGVSPGDIDTILLTHMHPDHSAGLTDMTNEQANYPNAELVVHKLEPKHWFDDGMMVSGTEREKELMFQQARDQCAPYKDRMRTFESGAVFPGVTSIPCPGHTPGHSGFLIESNGEALLIWGDTVHMPEVQVQSPEVTMTVDVDPSAAEASRRRIFDMAAAERLLVTGMHLHYPGFGHVVKEGSKFRYTPEAWVQRL